ncbi:MAG: Helix-hairpin-helix motif protein [Candidatus Roizmanbacteria bacterium GW2011_GWB1_40_7]|uniref:Helix-hairpin-helix motif protein n=2 Tax=Candidatus Roizmaniibacteriota TaxID=1752723 RepID=A0A0G0T4F2_9BACT|nr:MAG: Helix-hairpin-helix motif protein [Candidatus Roizmanbacteria bacterium GW2011_GWB1_40_7]
MVDDPYKIFVSEVMLQQTQVTRVLVKYPEFIKRFPTFRSLARASLKDVLTVWQGMGYNRRGKFLKEAAGIIVKDKRYEFMFHNRLSFPRTRESIELDRSRIKSGMTEQQMLKQVQHDNVDLLQLLPGVGHNTACAVVTYSFNMPTVFIETNIRAVYLYHFFKDKENVSDSDILNRVKNTLDMQNPRDWYYALTDYGAMLKKTKKFQNIQSKHYTKQSKFEGSRRQLRGRILKLLIESGPSSLNDIRSHLREDPRIEQIVEDMKNEGILEIIQTHYRIVGS